MIDKLIDESIRYAPAAISGGIFFLVRSHLSKMNDVIRRVIHHGERLAVLEDRCGISSSRTRGCEEGAD